MSATDHTLTDAKAERKAEPMAEPMFGMPIGPWFRWFAWHPVCTTDRGWRWLRPVWRRRYQTKPHLSGPVMRWFNESVTDPRGATR